MSEKPITHTYKGPGKYRGVPARDLTQVDYDRLPLDKQVAVDTGELYRKVEPKKAGDGKKKDGDA